MPLFSDDFESYAEVGSAISLSQLNPVYTGVSGDEVNYGAYVSGAVGQRKVYARLGAFGEFLYRVNVDAGLDHAVEFTAGNPTSSFIGIRMVGTNAATYIGVRISTNNVLQVYKVIGNAFTSLSSITGPFVAGTKIRAEVIGTTVKVYADNVLKFNAQVTDAALQTGRYISLHARNNNALWFDDLSIDTAVAQPTDISGSVAAAEANDTVQADGRVTVKATGALTEQDDFASGQGQVSVQAVGTFLDVGDVVSGTANVRIQATLSVQEDGDQAAASSSSTVFSAVAVTEENDSLTAVGTLRITGAANLSTDDNTSANGRVRIGAAAEMLEQADGATGAGASKVYGQSSIAELDDGVQASATLSLVGFVNSQEAGDVITVRGALATAAPQNIRRLVLFGRFSSPALCRGEVSSAARFSGARSTPIRLAGSV